MKILVFGAHPDDLEPQIGGTIAKLVKNNAKVKMITSFDTGTGANIEERRQESREASKILGAESLFLGLESNNFKFRDALKIFDDLIAEEKPSIVFSVNPNDSHQDHKNIANLVEATSRKNKFDLIYLNQVIPGGLHSPDLNYFTDISEFQEIKMKSCQCYKSQINKYGESWLEAVVGRDKYWGFNIGENFAEACVVKKIIINNAD